MGQEGYSDLVEFWWNTRAPETLLMGWQVQCRALGQQVSRPMQVKICSQGSLPFNSIIQQAS